MLKEYLLLFTHLTIVPVIIASLIGLIRYRRLPPSLRYLTLLACFDLLMELTATTLSLGVVRKALSINTNLFLFPFVSIGEVALLALAYRQVLQSVSFNKAMPWLLSLFSAYALFVSFSQWGMARYAVGLSTLVNLLMLGLAGLYFRKLLDELQVEQLRHEPFFYLSVGLVVYGLGNLLISLFSNYLITHCSVQLQLIIIWGVRNLFNIALYICYCLALWLGAREQVPAAIEPRVR
jgi:hypothetical protein